MKTLMTTAIVAALTLTSLSLGQDKVTPDESVKRSDVADKKLTIEDVRQMLEGMGFTPEPWKNAQGKLIGYVIKFEQDNLTYACDFQVSSNGQNLWIGGSYGQGIDGTASAEAVLKVLELNNAIWPAYIFYSSKFKNFVVEASAPMAGMTPAKLRGALNQFTSGMKSLVTTWKEFNNKEKTAAQLP